MLDDQPTGVGIYSVNVINYLSDFYKNNSERDISVFTPSKKHINSNIKTVSLSKLLQSSRYGKLAAITRFLWNTFLYPSSAKKFHVVLSTTTHGSFTTKNQIITIHDLLSLRFGNISLHQRFYFKFLLPSLISKAKFVVAVSETTKKDIVKFLNCPPEKIKVIYNGYDDSVYNTAHKKDGKLIYSNYKLQQYFLAVGPTYPHKNFELLIEAYSNLEEAVKANHPLLIAGGKRPYVDLIKKTVKEKKAEQYIHFAGYVPQHLMPALYNEAYALIFPSLYEGFGFPLLEAMASGCPVIASNVSSIPEVCGGAALYFDPYSISSLVNKIKLLVSKASLYDELKIRELSKLKSFLGKVPLVKSVI